MFSYLQFSLSSHLPTSGLWLPLKPEIHIGVAVILYAPEVSLIIITCPIQIRPDGAPPVIAEADAQLQPDPSLSAGIIHPEERRGNIVGSTRQEIPGIGVIDKKSDQGLHLVMAGIRARHAVVPATDELLKHRQTDKEGMHFVERLAPGGPVN